MQRLRVRYAKRARLRFASHRDVQRAVERAVRRAGLPIAHSAGFTPHPRISYANAVPTGAASEAEYLELGVTRPCDPAEVRAALDAALPVGLDVAEVVVAAGAPLADRLQASVWRVELPGVEPATAQAALDAFLAAERAEVQRLTKTGVRTFDARAAVVGGAVVGGVVPGGAVPGGAVRGAGNRVAQVQGEPCAILQVVVRHATPVVRPDDVLAALRSQADLAPPSPPRMTRLAQGPLDGASGAVADPLAAGTGAVDA